MLRLPARLHAVDATIVYRRHLSTSWPSSPCRSAVSLETHWLSPARLIALSRDPSLELRSELAGALERGEAACIAAIDGESIAGYVWFSAAGRQIAPALNSGGRRFRGIGLALPADVRYLYKAFVVPSARGAGIAGALIDVAARCFSDDGTQRIITTTDRANLAFQRTVKHLGFEPVATAVERRMFGWHRFTLPAAIDGDIELLAG